MTYEDLLAKQPLTTSAGDRLAAQAFVELLSTVIEGRGTTDLLDSQRRYLYKLRARWQARAAGTDLRWMVQGSRPGRPPRPDAEAHREREFRHRTRVQADPGEADPLFQSLLKKYGTPTTGTQDRGDE